MRLRRPSRFVERWLLLVVLIGIWQLAAASSNSPFFETPADIGQRVYELWFSGPWHDAFLTEAARADLLPSLVRLLLGWAIACVLAIVLGLALGMSRTLSDYVDPPIEFLRAIPSAALIPLFLIVLGSGDSMRVWMIATGVVWAPLLNTVEGVRTVSAVQLDTGRAFRVGRLARLTHIVLPSAAPKIAAGMRVALSQALILMVLSELVVSTNGIGHALIAAQRDFKFVDMWAGMVLLGVLGFLLNRAFSSIEGRVLGWHRAERGR